MAKQVPTEDYECITFVTYISRMTDDLLNPAEESGGYKGMDDGYRIQEGVTSARVRLLGIVYHLCTL